MGILDWFKSKEQRLKNPSMRKSFQKDTEQVWAEIYKKLARKLVETIPCPWEKIYYLGEVEKGKYSWSSAFYFLDLRNQIIDGNSIPSIYKVPNDVFDSQLHEINKILLELYESFEKAGQELWEQVIFSVDSNGRFSIEFRYDIMNENDGGQVMRETVWAYETFQYKPKEGTYTRKLLDRWRNQQQP